MEEAIAALAAARHAFAQHETVTREHRNARWAPRRIVKMDEARLLACGDFIPQFHDRFEQT